MDSFFQGLAISFGIWVGLIHPPSDLRLEVEILQARNQLMVEALVEGGATKEVERYILAGNELTLVFEIQWGERLWKRTRTLGYQAWEGVFTLSTNDSIETLPFSDKSTAFQNWLRFAPSPLGSLEELEQSLGRAIILRSFLLESHPSRGRLGALWGYRVIEESRVYQFWTEVPH